MSQQVAADGIQSAQQRDGRYQRHPMTTRPVEAEPIGPQALEEFYRTPNVIRLGGNSYSEFGEMTGRLRPGRRHKVIPTGDRN